MKITDPARPRSGRSVVNGLFLAAAVTLAPAIAGAASVAVDCNAGGSIGAALAPLDQQGPHTITVVGTCIEGVAIVDRERVTIQAPPGQTATIRRPAGPGLPAAVFVNGSTGVVLNRLVLTGPVNGLYVVRRADVSALQVTSENNGGNGMVAIGNSNLAVTASIVRNNAFAGIFGSDGSVVPVGGGTVIEGNGSIGVILNNNTHAPFIGNRVERNAALGIALFHSSTMDLINSTIAGNAAGGVLIAEDSHADLAGDTITGNGAGVGVETPGGFFVSENSGAYIGTSTITNNTGPGILATINATLSLQPGNTVSGNSETGVRVERMSVGRFLGAGAFASNADADLECDTTSLVVGDLSSVQDIRCFRIEREHGPPRPGHVFDSATP
jgi:parallel beta helix pectate lyase-like protein